MSNNSFIKDAIEGLTKIPKSISSKYLYNEQGNKLFQAIMSTHDYYPTACEYEIIEENVASILAPFLSQESFNLVDFGAGDGKKTKLFLRYLDKIKKPFHYIPIDISLDILQILEKDFKVEFPDLQILPLERDYFEAIYEINRLNHYPKLILFLGSNIGNLNTIDSLQFLSKLNQALYMGDGLLLGADLKKDPQTILNAYNDAEGITREFNLNILNRLNQELQTNFVKENFYHYPLYDPETGTAKSFLVSKIKQDIFVPTLHKPIHFESGEPIFLEISQKYDLQILHKWANETNFFVLRDYHDHKNYFLDTLWTKP
jgi:L-histidine Nalpha-methyltransferase